MEIKTVQISDLVPYKNNPRRNDEAVEFVENNIEEFGFKIPLVIDENNVIICIVIIRGALMRGQP